MKYFKFHIQFSDEKKNIRNLIFKLETYENISNDNNKYMNRIYYLLGENIDIHCYMPDV